MVIAGVILVVLGLAGAINACVTGLADRGLVVAGVAGLVFAAGCALIVIGAGRLGYHYRPKGAPPGDMSLDEPQDPRDIPRGQPR
jgi:hypothetical protein